MIETKRKSLSYWLVAFALFGSFFLSLLSYFEICGEACKAGLHWNLFGVPLAPIGLLFFSVLLGLHTLSPQKPGIKRWIGYALAGALGAEVVLIYIQKAKIGHWCPLCLGVAMLVALGCLVYLVNYLKELQNKGELMKNLQKGLTSLSLFVLGFLTLVVGIGHESPLEAMENTVKERLVFGNPSAPASIYLFTDWACPACRSLEPHLKSLIPTLTTKAKLLFVDLPVHPATLNYSPYNLAFMANNKGQYLQLRDALTELSQTTDKPTQAQVEKLASKLGARLVELNYSDVALGLKYWEELADKYKVDATPTMVIVTPKNPKGIKLEGEHEITEARILKALDAGK